MSNLPTGYTPAKELTQASGLGTATKAATLAYEAVKGIDQPMATAADVSNFVREQSGHHINASKIRRICREGRAGITPNRRKETFQNGRYCQGIKKLDDQRSLTYLARSFRKDAASIVNSDNDLFKQVKSAADSKNLGKQIELKQFLSGAEGTHTWILEDGSIVMRAMTCDPTKLVAASSRCEACDKLSAKIQNDIWHCRPAGEKPQIHPKTNIKYISDDPQLADHEIRRLREENRRLRRQMIAIEAHKLIQSKKAFVVTNDDKKVQMIDQVFQTAIQNFDQAFPTQSNSTNEDARDLLEVYYEHVHSKQKYFTNGGKKDGGFRCHPLLFQFAVMILAKTSHSVYNELAKVLRKQKEVVGKRGSHHGVRVEAIADLYSSLCALAKSRTGQDQFVAGSNELLGALSFDSMKTMEGLQYDIHDQLSGLDQHTQFDVVERNFMAMAKAAAAKSGVDGAVPSADDTERCFLEESSTVVKHHLVWKWTAIFDGIDVSRTVGSLNLSELKPSMLQNTLHSILIELHLHGLGTAVVVGDGAGENTKFFQACSEVPASRYISPALQEKFKGVDFGFSVAMLHPITDEPIFVIEDMPHVVKRIVNALERSSNPRAKRDLHFNGEPLNLSMIRNIWEATGGKTNRLQDTKLTTKHFNKNANSRMVVSLAVQLLSQCVVDLMKKAIADPKVIPILKLHPWAYKSIIKLAELVNELVDIVNGRSTKRGEYQAHFSPSEAKSIQERLLSILQWFTEWENAVQKHNTHKIDTHFLAEQTWNGVKRMILGYVGLIEYYVTQKNFVIVPRRTTSDPCENHFSNTRACFGSGNAGTALMCDQADARSDFFSHASDYYGRGNNAQAPKLFGRRKRY